MEEKKGDSPDPVKDEKTVLENVENTKDEKVNNHLQEETIVAPIADETVISSSYNDEDTMISSTPNASEEIIVSENLDIQVDFSDSENLEDTVEITDETIIDNASEEKSTPVNDVTLENSNVESNLIEANQQENTIVEAVVVSQEISEEPSKNATEENIEIIEDGEAKEMSSGFAVKILQKKGTLENVTIPFLNLDGLQFEMPVLIRNCQLEGFVARGSTFKQGLHIEKCQFKERLELSAWRKEEGFENTIVEQGLVLKDSTFHDLIAMRNAQINGNISVENCEFTNTFRLDRCQINGNVYFVGPGKLTLLSAFLCRCSGEIKIDNYELLGDKERKQSLDLNSSNFVSVALLNCLLQNDFDMKRAYIGEGLEDDCLRIYNCSFQGIDFSESVMKGKTYCGESKINGPFKAEMPLEKKKFNKVGRPTLFQNDANFDNIEFFAKSSFYSARFMNYAKFTRCIFHKDANFNQCEFAQVSSFWTSEFIASGNFRKCAFRGRSNFGKVKLGNKSSFNESVFEDEASFYLAEITGDAFFSKAIFNHNLVLRNVSCEGGLNLSQIHVEKDLKISSSNIRGRFILSGCNIEGNFSAPALNIGTWGSLAESRIKGQVDLGGLKVGRNLSKEEKETLKSLKKDQEIEPFLARKKEDQEEIVPGTMYFSKSVFLKDLNLFAMSIAGDLDMNGMSCYSEIDLNNLDVGHNLLLSKVYFRGMLRCEHGNIANNVMAEKSRFKEEISWNGMNCNNFSLSYSSFDGGFTMRYAKIRNTLMMKNTDVDGKADLFRCKLDKIYFPHMIVDHFLIDRNILGGILPSEKEEKYSNAVIEYGILKQAFQKRNDYESLDWAYYSFCRCKRRNKKASWKSPMRSIKIFLDWVFLDLGFGYGTRPMNIAGVALSCILLFAGLFYFFPQGILGSTGEALNYISFTDSFHMSITTFASMDYTNSGPDIHHWLKHFFSLEGILGIFLTTLFVATISRKIIRT